MSGTVAWYSVLLTAMQENLDNELVDINLSIGTVA